jgi:hypothetical protein
MAYPVLGIAASFSSLTLSSRPMVCASVATIGCLVYAFLRGSSLSFVYCIVPPSEGFSRFGRTFAGWRHRVAAVWGL